MMLVSVWMSANSQWKDMHEETRRLSGKFSLAWNSKRTSTGPYFNDSFYLEKSITTRGAKSINSPLDSIDYNDQNC